MFLSYMQLVLLIVVALMGIPLGVLISKGTKEEIVKGMKWFKVLIGLSFVSFIASFYFLSGSDMALLMTSSAFIALLSATSLVMGRRML